MVDSLGFIKLNRKILNWEWYDDINVSRLFIHCLLMANFRDRNYRGTLIKRGSFVTSYDLLSIETGLSVMQIRTALNKLKSTGELTTHSTNKGTLISVLKWELYQSRDDDDNMHSDTQPNNPITNEQQTDNKRVTTNKNVKNIKNDKNNKDMGQKSTRFIPPKLEEVLQYCLSRNNSVDPQKFIDFYSAKGWYIGKNKMKDWKAAVRTWENNQKTNSSAKQKSRPVIKKAPDEEPPKDAVDLDEQIKEINKIIGSLE